MGSRIAAHIANAGVPVVLLDIVPPGIAADADKAAKNKFVLAALDGLKKSKPAAFFVPENARLITIGNFDDDLALIADCDWIIEVVAEDLEIKRALLTKVQQHRRPNSIVTSNTSGLPIHKIVEGMSEDLRHHWFGTHFFNPPRYMRLLEIIPTPDTDPADVALIEHFCDLRLGKAIVHSHDTPNFIANRIGTFSMGNAIRLMQSQGLSIEEVDTLTGSALGWPKTGTFRLGDMVGIDVLAHVAKNFEAQAAAIKDERADVTLAPFIGRMIEKKWLGDKTGQGFYKKEGKDAEGRDMRLVIDLADAGVQAEHAAEVSRARHGEERRVDRRSYSAASSRGRRQGQGCCLLLAAAHGALHLLRQPRSRDCRQHRRDRSGDEDGLQLGAGAV